MSETWAEVTEPVVVTYGGTVYDGDGAPYGYAEEQETWDEVED
jgi:hypothetical protein